MTSCENEKDGSDRRAHLLADDFSHSIIDGIQAKQILPKMSANTSSLYGAKRRL